MTDPTQIQLADLTAAFATLGIHLDPDAVSGITIRPGCMTIDRYRLDESGRVHLGDSGEIAREVTQIAINVGGVEPKCTCPDYDTSRLGPDGMIPSSIKGLDPACPQHGSTT